MTQYIFKKDIAGSNDGINVVEYAKGDKVKEADLSEYLKEEWLKNGVIEILNADVESEEEIPEETETETETDEADEEEANTGDEEVDDFLNGETDEIPEGTEEITEEEALILEAKEILNADVESEEEINSDRLKEIGIILNIPKMNNTVNPAKIIEKISKFIEDYDAEKEN